MAGDPRAELPRVSSAAGASFFYQPATAAAPAPKRVLAVVVLRWSLATRGNRIVVPGMPQPVSFV
ncbi:MAG: hypothetical protein WA609_09800 [Terriglobales bacterium]